MASSDSLMPFLEELQECALATFGPKDFDPKFYIDLPLRFPLPQTRRVFHELPRLENNLPSKEDFTAFVDQYFEDPGSDVALHLPLDFSEEPEGFLPLVKQPEVREWALKVHSLWRELCRKVTEEVKTNPEQHTILPLPEAIVIAGSRFREVYYWDSYWIVRGLLASKMYETAMAVVKNLVWLIENYGFVPNGARSYYLNRSQPPLLSAMVRAIYVRTKDISLLRLALPALFQEHKFWNSGFHKVVVKDENGCEHSLSQYHANWDSPRPECSTIDKVTAEALMGNEKLSLYREIATAAESGWDFSSRWMSDQKNLITLCTSRIIPVDLNAFLLQMELNISAFANVVEEKSIARTFIQLLNISAFANVVEEKSIARTFIQAADARYTAMNTILWNDEMAQWLDYWLDSNAYSSNQDHGNDHEEIHIFNKNNQNKNVFASNFVPLWVELFHSDARVDRVIKAFQRSGLIQPAGISTSLLNSGQQWDIPNGWAPLQHMIIEGIAKSTFREGMLLAENIARRWLITNYITFIQTSAMHEKYNVEVLGKIGGGGEYTTQTGFGWSNGVVLALLEEFGWPVDLPI